MIRLKSRGGWTFKRLRFPVRRIVCVAQAPALILGPVEGEKKMELTPLGALTAQFGPPERLAVARKLMQAQNTDRIENYIVRGICYDAVAFVRYLLGARITPLQLISTTGKAWRPLLNRAGNLWHGGAIASGTAVVFRRPARDPVNNNPIRDPGPYHVSMALGRGCVIRGVNGGSFGLGWQSIGDGNIDIVTSRIQPYPANQVQPTTFKWGTDPQIFDVWLSNL